MKQMKTACAVALLGTGAGLVLYSLGISDLFDAQAADSALMHSMSRSMWLLLLGIAVGLGGLAVLNTRRTP